MSELIVYVEGRRAGRLIRKDNGNLQFRYDAGYDGPPVSRSMPLREEAHPHARAAGLSAARATRRETRTSRSSATTAT